MQDNLGLKPNQPRRIVRVPDWKMIRYSQTALSNKEAYGTLPVLLKNLGRSPKVT